VRYTVGAETEKAQTRKRRW